MKMKKWLFLFISLISFSSFSGIYEPLYNHIRDSYGREEGKVLHCPGNFTVTNVPMAYLYQEKDSELQAGFLDLLAREKCNIEMPFEVKMKEGKKEKVSIS